MIFFLVFSNFNLNNIFADSKINQEKLDSNVEEIKSNFLNKLKDLTYQLKRLQSESANTLNGIEESKTIFHQAKNTYKEIEWLADYLDHEYVESYINGGPIPSLEKDQDKSSKIHLVQGFQKIEELMYQMDSQSPREELTQLCVNLFDNTLKFKTMIEDKNNNSSNSIAKLNSNRILNAIKINVIRVYALGTTAFDVPSSGKALEESSISLNSSFQNFQILQNGIFKNTPTSLDSTMYYFEKANFKLKESDNFEYFDRFAYYKNLVHPLLKNLNQFQKDNNLQSDEDIINLNKQFTGIYSSDFFNIYKFSKVSEKANNPKLKELGKTLFFDPIMSNNNRRACASCHKPEKAFTDGLPKSLAFDFKGTVARNTPALINSIYSDRFFYDLRAEGIENQFGFVIESEKEFHSSYPEIITKLNESKDYQKLFEEAFGKSDTLISKTKIQMAISSYMMSLTSFDSKFEKMIRGEMLDTGLVNSKIIRGYNLFMGVAKCGTCHFAPTFSGLVPPYYHEMESEVLGVAKVDVEENAELDDDLGVYGVSKVKEADFQKHSFKTLTLKNISKTAPYMHNGAYADLESVIVFYNHGGGAGMGLDVKNQTLSAEHLRLPENDQKAIIAFLNSLDDMNVDLTPVKQLPKFKDKKLNARKIGGEY